MTDYSELLASLGVEIGHELLELALTHRSFAYENGGIPTNERLEFLGDAVLGVNVTETLYCSFPDLPEGQLARRRAAVVNMDALASVGRKLGIGAFLRLGKGETSDGGNDKSSILADTVEALIGATFLYAGPAVAKDLVRRLIDPLIQEAHGHGIGFDWKTSLQELAAAHQMQVTYEITEVGPDHAKQYTAWAVVGGTKWASGTGRSKKEAEKQAAQGAWKAMVDTGITATTDVP